MLTVNQLCGFGSAPASEGGATGTVTSIAYAGGAVDGTDGTSFTFSGHSISTASATRVVVIGVTGKASATRTVSSVTIGGVTASVAVAYDNNSSSFVGSGLYYLLVTSGTTADIVVTFSSTMTSAGIDVWAHYDATATTPALTSSGSGSSTDVSCGTINAVSGDALIAIVGANSASSPRTHTWDSPLVEASDGAMEANAVKTGADKLLASSVGEFGTTASATVTFFGCAAVWR